MEQISSLYIILAGILWGIISLFVTQLQSAGLSSMQIVSVRVFFSAVIMVLFLLIRDLKRLKIKLRDLPLFFGTGVLSIVFFNFCYFKAIELTGGAAVPALLASSELKSMKMPSAREAISRSSSVMPSRL